MFGQNPLWQGKTHPCGSSLSAAKTLFSPPFSMMNVYWPSCWQAVVWVGFPSVFVVQQLWSNPSTRKQHVQTTGPHGELYATLHLTFSCVCMTENIWVNVLISRSMLENIKPSGETGLEYVKHYLQLQVVLVSLTWDLQSVRRISTLGAQTWEELTYFSAVRKMQSDSCSLRAEACQPKPLNY